MMSAVEPEVGGGVCHTLQHKQSYLYGVAWSKEGDGRIAKEAERK